MTATLPHSCALLLSYLNFHEWKTPGSSNTLKTSQIAQQSAAKNILLHFIWPPQALEALNYQCPEKPTCPQFSICPCLVQHLILSPSLPVLPRNSHFHSFAQRLASTIVTSQ
ncbi:rCG36778 [Rattus norvegicus]|uniref:RCG36778 n=1 Tax=Rattus norvegicus TaxID=10116 RepID=A6JS13_RAT|nr:rCG36778 [Rattus norvegicus]